MTQSLKTGDVVSAETFGGKRVRMRVVDLEGDTVYICKENEWLSAQEENREPCSVGFNRRYINTQRMQPAGEANDRS